MTKPRDARSRSGRPLTRRDFLGRSAALASGLAFPLPLRHLSGAFAPSERPILVAIYLRGGHDPLQTLIPYKDPEYYAVRPTIAIPAEGEGTPKPIALDAEWALHPSLGSLAELWNEGLFAPLVCTGSPHPTRSHFDAQDFMEYAAPGLRTIRDGWLNRYLAATADRHGKDSELRALAMQGLLPRSLRGAYPVLAVPQGRTQGTDELLDFFDDLYLEGEGGGNAPPEERPEEDAQMRSGRMQRRRREEEMQERSEDEVVAIGRATIETLRRYRAIEARGAQRRSSVRYPRGALGPGLERIAHVIHSGEPLEVACLDWNGWDHHAGQGGLDGRYTQMITHVADSIRAFLQDLGPHAKRTLVVTMTEFGRTVRENGNSGTDHGHGGMMLLCGGPVRGKKVHGRWPGLSEKQLYQGRDLQVTTDFRDVFAEILQRHLGFEPPKGFFPDYRPKKLGILG